MLYCRDPVNILLEQVAVTAPNKIMIKHYSASAISHSLNAEIEKKAGEAAENKVKLALNDQVF